VEKNAYIASLTLDRIASDGRTKHCRMKPTSPTCSRCNWDAVWLESVCECEHSSATSLPPAATVWRYGLSLTNHRR